MTQILQIVLSVVMLGSLSACSMYNESFDCPAGIGVGCKALSRVDDMVENGQLPRPVEEEGFSISNIFGNSAEAKLVEAEPRIVPVTGEEVASPVWRVPEKTMRVWIKGYPDTAGNYHADSIVYTVVKPATWSVK